MDVSTNNVSTIDVQIVEIRIELNGIVIDSMQFVFELEKICNAIKNILLLKLVCNGKI